MGKRLKVYLDTSVPNAYLDERDLSRREKTRTFWNKLQEYEVFVSDLVFKEIEDIGDSGNREHLLALLTGLTVLSSREEQVRALTEEYVGRGIIPVKHIEDAIHIAVATFYGIDVLASWNFEHIVKVKTKREVNVINVLLG